MYYILGVVPKSDLPKLQLLDSFDALYSQLSSTCSFVPSFGKSFQEKLKYCIRQRPLKRELPVETSVEMIEESKTVDDFKFELEDMEKQIKVKSV